jgi:hypothetical protein
MTAQSGPQQEAAVRESPGDDYMLSADAQTLRTTWGRVSTRADVETNPPGILDRFNGKTT